MTRHTTTPPETLRLLAEELDDLDELTLDRPALVELASFFASARRLHDRLGHTGADTLVVVTRLGRALERLLGREHQGDTDDQALARFVAIIDGPDLDELTLDRAVLAELADTLDAHRNLWSGPERSPVASRLRVTSLGRALEWRLGREHLVAPHPLPEVPTVEDVRAHPDYWIAGPGRLVAERTRCAHDYFLTDSCPCC
jgi:hypothetical protein